VESCDDATYHVRGVGSISFHMPSSDVLDWSDVLIVPSLKKNPPHQQLQILDWI
jgi:hypothetical protein